MSNEKIKVISLRGEVIEGETLNGLIEQVGESDFEQLVLKIASRGGSVREGLNIMVWLDSLSQKGKEIITVVEANAYSIASLIMLAADVKLISKHGEVMVHNPMLPELSYVNANELEIHLNKLRELESDMYGIYSMFTGLDNEDIKSLMDKETYLNPQEAVKNGFADMVVDMKPKQYDSPENDEEAEVKAENKKSKINMIKHINSLKRVIATINNDDFVNITYNLVGGAKLEVFQEDQATYKVGDKTDMKEGSAKIGDGSTLIIKDYKIESIEKEVEKTEVENSNVGEAPEGDTKKEALEATAEKVEDEVKNTEIKRVSAWEANVVNDTFEVGTKVEYKGTEMDPEPTSVGVGEWKLEDGRCFLTDADGIIRVFLYDGKEAEAPVEAPVEEPVEAPAPESNEEKVEEVVEAVEETEDEVKPEVKPEAEHTPDHKMEMDELKEAVKAMSEKITEMAEKFEKVESDAVEANEFREKAADAISTIASQTGSNFTPKAAKVNKPLVGANGTGTIFQLAKARAIQAKKNK
jgi:ATP-dependent protease ClpP protease subunit